MGAEAFPDGGAVAREVEARLRRKLETVPVARDQGLQLVQLAPGRAELRLPWTEAISNGNGSIHGGVLASFADSALAFALATIFEGEMTFATSNLNVHYLRPARGDVVARAETLRAGNTVATGEVDLVDEDGQLLVRAVATFVLAPGSRRSNDKTYPVLDDGQGE